MQRTRGRRLVVYTCRDMSTLVLALALAVSGPQRVLAVHTPSGDISARRVALYEAHLKRELAKHEGLVVVDETLSQTPRDPACVSEPSCLAKLAESVGAELVVFVRTARLGSDSVITMKRLRLATGEIEQTSTRSFVGGDGEEMLTALGPMVDELFPDNTLVPGAALGVTHSDAVRWSPPPVAPWVFWAGVGATAVAAGSIAVFAIQKSDAEDDFARMVQGETANGAELVEIANKAESAKTRTNVAIGVTAGLGVTTAILAYFTDWHRDRDTEILVGPNGGAVRTTF